MACTKELIHKKFGEKPNISREQVCYLSSFSIPVPNLILVQAYLNNEHCPNGGHYLPAGRYYVYSKYSTTEM